MHELLAADKGPARRPIPVVSDTERERPGGHGQDDGGGTGGSAVGPRHGDVPPRDGYQGQSALIARARQHRDGRAPLDAVRRVRHPDLGGAGLLVGAPGEGPGQVTATDRPQVLRCALWAVRGHEHDELHRHGGRDRRGCQGIRPCLGGAHRPGEDHRRGLSLRHRAGEQACDDGRAAGDGDQAAAGEAAAGRADGGRSMARRGTGVRVTHGYWFRPGVTDGKIIGHRDRTHSSDPRRWNSHQTYLVSSSSPIRDLQEVLIAGGGDWVE